MWHVEWTVLTSQMMRRGVVAVQSALQADTLANRNVASDARFASVALDLTIAMMMGVAASLLVSVVLVAIAGTLASMRDARHHRDRASSPSSMISRESHDASDD